MNKRTTRWYRKNEEEVMRSLGLEPTKNSGSGWIEKEDGQNDYLICQLKSTDMGSIGVKKKDLETLEYNASVSYKIPVFVLQYIGDTLDDIWIMVKPTDIEQVSKYINTGKCEIEKQQIEIDVKPDKKNVERKVIRSGHEARKKLEKEREESFGWKFRKKR